MVSRLPGLSNTGPADPRHLRHSASVPPAPPRPSARPPARLLYLDALLSKETLFERDKVACKLSLL